MIRNAIVRLASCVVLSGALSFSAPSKATAQVPFEELHTTTRAKIRSPKLEIVTSQDQFVNAWRELGRRDAAPPVDFRRQSVVIYFAGVKATTGYGVAIERIGVRAGSLEIDVVETIPGDRCGTGQTATFPAVAVLTIPWKHEAEPNLRRVEHNCN